MAGVPGGVTPLPLALLSPMTFTNSLTDTPINSGGISLFAAAIKGFLEVGGLCEAVRLIASLLNSFWKKLGFLLASPGDGVLKNEIIYKIGI